MNCNVGGTDRTVRYSVGSAALALALFGKMSKGKRIAALALAGSEFFTATTRYCPLNQAFGINTCEPKKQAVQNAATRPDSQATTDFKNAERQETSQTT